MKITPKTIKEQPAVFKPYTIEIEVENQADFDLLQKITWKNQMIPEVVYSAYPSDTIYEQTKHFLDNLGEALENGRKRSSN
jgi:hypothetical protein